MKIAKTVLILTMFALTLACGYNSPKSTPPVAGTMPAIAQLNPDSASHGSAGFNMIVNGSNFSTKAYVNWNGAAQTANTTFVTANQLTVTVPAALIANSGDVQITVTNPGTAGTGPYGNGGTLAETSAAMTFTIN